MGDLLQLRNIPGNVTAIEVTRPAEWTAAAFHSLDFPNLAGVIPLPDPYARLEAAGWKRAEGPAFRRPKDRSPPSANPFDYFPWVRVEKPAVIHIYDAGFALCGAMDGELVRTHMLANCPHCLERV